MVLSQRLTAVSMFVSRGMRLCDVGTDHAFVPIFLVEQNRIPSAIAMDVNEGPLLRAQEHIRAHGLQDRIETRLSDGLDRLGRDEADTVLIAGMGGALTVRILDRKQDLPQEAGELILQPQSEIASVRNYLGRSGWKIVQEKMIREDGKYYQAMRCVRGKMCLTPVQAEYGPCLMAEKDPVWRDYILWRRGILERNLVNLQSAEGQRGADRREEIEKELEITGIVLEGTGI